MELNGRITQIFETQQINENFQKRELVLQTLEEYPQTHKIEFIGDKCAVLNAFNVGDLVNIGINLRGREYTAQNGETRYFTSLQGWRISNQQSATNANNLQQKAAPPTIAESNDNDLPF